MKIPAIQRHPFARYAAERRTLARASAIFRSNLG
jgi:hypothetical protein